MVQKLYADESCRVKIQDGFHVQHLIAIISLSTSLTDCLLACIKTQACHSVNYIGSASRLVEQTESGGDGRCFLSASNVKDVHSLRNIKKSIHASFVCQGDFKKPRYLPTLFHGAAPRQCGTSAFNPVGQNMLAKRIISGTKAPPYSQPWLGQVIYQSANICGINLVIQDNDARYSATSFAISSAHCFHDNSNIKLPSWSFGFLFGVHDLRFFSAHAVFRTAEQIITHADYDGISKNNDIALIIFQEKIRLNDYVRPICMPVSSTAASSAASAGVDPPVGVACSICGYGLEFFNVASGQKIYSHVPNCFKAKLLRPESAKTLVPLPNLRRKTYYLSESDNIRYKGTGEGDSGGAVSCLMENKNTMFGVVSAFGSSAAEKVAVMNVFTRVSYYMKWIDDAMERNLDGKNTSDNYSSSADFYEEGRSPLRCLTC